MKSAIGIKMMGPLAVMMIFMLSISASALTTFGKTSPQNQNPPPPPTPADYHAQNNATFGRLTSAGRAGGRPGPKTSYLGHSFGKARECKTEADCAGIQNTSCIAEPRDGKTRCLCGDFSAPVNGLCTNKFKAVNAPCNDHAECGEGAQCVQANSTMNGKRCECMEGYYVENMKCNGSLSLLNNSSTLVLLFSLILLRNISYS